MLKVVIDTVVFVRSLINPQSRSGRIVFDYNKSYHLFVSELIVKEILEVLQRPSLTSKFHALLKKNFSKVLDILGQAPVIEISDIPLVSRDIKDNKFLETAVKAKADYLVSEDRDVLDLKRYQGVEIINTETFILLLGKEKL